MDLPLLPTEIDPNLLRAVIAFLRRTSLPIEPRKQGPGDGLSGYRVKGRIAASERAEVGRALCVLRTRSRYRFMKHQGHPIADGTVDHRSPR